MSSRRFVVENPEWLAELRRWHSVNVEAALRLKEFLDKHDIRSVVYEHHPVEGRQVVGFEDPRLLNPPKKLPCAGFIKSRKHPGFVMARADAVTPAERLLKTFSNKPAKAVIGAILLYISRLNTFNAGRLTVTPAHPYVRYWSGNTAEGPKLFWMTIDAVGEEFLVSIPDPMLRFDSVPGLREIKEWEALNMIEEHNERVRNKEV